MLVDTLGSAFPSAGEGAPRSLVLAILYAALAAVNVRGARAGARLSVTFAVVKIAPLAVLVIAGAFAAHGSNLRWVGMPSVLQVGQTAVLLFFAFIGVEGGLNISGEVANLSRTVPRAILLALTLVAARYLGLQTVAQGVLGERLPGEPAPLVALASAVFGPWGTGLLFAPTLLSIAGFLSADVLGSPRVFAALAERNQLPRMLAAVHPRFKAPARDLCLHASVRGDRVVGVVP